MTYSRAVADALGGRLEHCGGARDGPGPGSASRQDDTSREKPQEVRIESDASQDDSVDLGAVTDHQTEHGRRER